MNPGTIGLLITAVVFGLFGWVVARLLSRSLGAQVLVVLSILLVIAAIAASFIEGGIWLVGVDQYGGPLNLAIIAFCLGGSVGLLIRVRERHRLVKA